MFVAASAAARLRGLAVALIAVAISVLGLGVTPAQATGVVTVPGYGAESTEPFTLAPGIYRAELIYTDNVEYSGAPTTFEATLNDRNGTIATLAHDTATHNDTRRIIGFSSSTTLSVAVRVASLGANWKVSFTPLSAPSTAVTSLTATGTGTEAPTLYQLRAGSYTAAVTYAGNTGVADFRVALVGIGERQLLADAAAASGKVTKVARLTTTGTRWIEVSAGSRATWSVTMIRLLNLTRTPTPTISGRTKVGRTLTATPGTWKPSGVKLSYRWMRGTTTISKATKSTYKLTSADKAKKITVTVTGSRTGYLTVSKTSKATAAVKT